MNLEMIPLAMGAVLVVAMLLEIRVGRIPNWLTLLPFLLFAILLVFTEDRTPLYWQMGLAAGVFVFGLVLFAIGGSGAGAGGRGAVDRVGVAVARNDEERRRVGERRVAARPLGVALRHVA